MDDLHYHYVLGNQLATVEDQGNTTEGFLDGNTTLIDYHYDANGNLTADHNKGLTSIGYNHLNLPEQITKSQNQSITFQYSLSRFGGSAAGNKLKKTVTDGAHTTITHYLGGIQYTETSGSITLDFLQTAEGRVIDPTGTPTYEYHLTDHLGNVRVVLDQTGTITQSNQYYPFGMTWRTPGGAPPTNDYLFQGQEHHAELGWDQFKWRNADPALGRFFSVDPLAEDYVHNSTYAFSENKVVSHVELEGLEAFYINTPTWHIFRGRHSSGGQEATATTGVSIAYPKAALSVGSVKRGGTNISSISGRIARHVAEDGNMSVGIGSERNAFRHVLWQTAITNRFGETKAKAFGNAHEGVKFRSEIEIDMSEPMPQDRDMADQIVDVLNNEIGRDIALGSNAGPNQVGLARAVLDAQYNKGFWVVNVDSNGNIYISRERISRAQYNRAWEALNTLDQNGMNQEDRDALENDEENNDEQ